MFGCCIVLVVRDRHGRDRQLRRVPEIQRIPVREVEVASQSVVVAAKALPVGALVGPDDVRTGARGRRRARSPGRSRRADDVVGRGLLAAGARRTSRSPRSKLAPREAGAGLPPTIPLGMRAISVKVNEVIGVAGLRRARHPRRRPRDGQPSSDDAIDAHRRQQRAGADRRHARTTRRRPRTASRSRRRS